MPNQPLAITPSSLAAIFIIAYKVLFLVRLLETTAVRPGVSGPLFWDEPETNLNPKLIRMLVEILLEMSRMGQQIIIATHDYILLKWFAILSQERDLVTFHSLSMDEISGEISRKTTKNYLDITPNAIVDAFNELTITQAKLKLQGAGQ